uniref:Uncharacterized protein n=1 Tax=Eutreptiella gymnastica TaxID=73025 RepID=A0A7S1IMW9_9EUGL|mmetsp:Transcript_30483/g.54791  ORF Transcript_30483/g.54791 Transcript_30483/m.54791 type:complete len:108 (+) Transcript_30483:704-1027(+)
MGLSRGHFYFNVPQTGPQILEHYCNIHRTVCDKGGYPGLRQGFFQSCTMLDVCRRSHSTCTTMGVLWVLHHGLCYTESAMKVIKLCHKLWYSSKNVIFSLPNYHLRN